MKTMKFMNYCIASLFVMSFVLASQVNAQEGCNITITLDNSNCNDNSLIGGCGSCSAPCDCKGCSDCCECFEARFESTFSFPGLDPMGESSITLTPFIQEPNGRVTVGDAVVATGANNTISISQCLKACLRCDCDYKVGYTILVNAGGDEILGYEQTRNKDSVCICGKHSELNSVPLLQIGLSALFIEEGFAGVAPFTTVAVCCCDCPPKSCAGCSCLDDGRDCDLPFLRPTEEN